VGGVRRSTPGRVLQPACVVVTMDTATYGKQSRAPARTPGLLTDSDVDQYLQVLAAFVRANWLSHAGWYLCCTRPTGPVPGNRDGTRVLALVVLPRRLGKDGRWFGLAGYVAVAGALLLWGFPVMGAVVIPTTPRCTTAPDSANSC
jgi:hypothetical protein